MLPERLAALQLLKPGVDARGQERLVALCHAGALVGGLSVALDVRPDELVGPLCAEAGGPARRLKVLDARDRPEPELLVWVDGAEEAWPAADVRALVTAFNARFRDAADVRAVALLGEWEQMLQLWCVEKRRLGALFREPWFQPENALE